MKCKCIYARKSSLSPHPSHTHSQDKLAELSLQHSNLQELLGALTDRTSSSVAARLTEWHARLGEMRLREMKTNRENGRYVCVCLARVV